MTQDGNFCANSFTAKPSEQRNLQIAILAESLKQHDIQFKETNGVCPPEALLYDRGAIVPALVISPKSEEEVARILKILKHMKLYSFLPISVKSGGHGYFNGASCSGIMLNLADMTKQHIANNTLVLEPGCVLGQIIHTLASHHKAVPHGDFFGVGAGGHFLTAGWDRLLSRRYGLGCQSVVGGRIVLWDGTVMEVDEINNPELLHAMRGGAVAKSGVVTEIRLRLIDEPSGVTWRFTRITKEQLETCVKHHVFSKAASLPNDISISFRFSFQPNQLEPVCSFNIFSLLPIDQTIHCLREHLDEEVVSLVADSSLWVGKSLLDLRMLPASESLAANPDMLAKLSSTALHENPQAYYSPRETVRAFFTLSSHWIVSECEGIFLQLYKAFQSAPEPARQRMSVLIIQGGGCMSELQSVCSMPLGQTLARFELRHNSHRKEEDSCGNFPQNISDIIESKADLAPGRPYRGDIWLKEQANDPLLDAVLETYDRRFM